MLVKFLLEGYSLRLLKDEYTRGFGYGDGHGKGDVDMLGYGFGNGEGRGSGPRDRPELGYERGCGRGGWSKNGVIHCGWGHGTANGNGVVGPQANYDQAAKPTTYIVEE